MLVGHRTATEIAVFASLLIWVAGCMGGALSPKTRRSLSSVSIDPEVTIARFEYFGKAQQVSVWFGGAPGGAISKAAGAGKTEGEEILEVMAENNIDLREMMISIFKEQLEAKSGFPPLVEAAADAEFSFEVSCLFTMGLFGHRLKPEIWVWTFLKKPNGDVLWKKFVVSKNGEGYMHDRYVNDPELLADVLRQAFESAAKQIVKNL